MRGKSVSIAVILMIVSVCAFVWYMIYISSTDADCGDPNWNKTHSSVSTEEEALELFGRDLYIQEFVSFVNGTTQAGRNFTFELEYKEDGSVDNTESWTLFEIKSINMKIGHLAFF